MSNLSLLRQEIPKSREHQTPDTEVSAAEAAIPESAEESLGDEAVKAGPRRQRLGSLWLMAICLAFQRPGLKTHIAFQIPHPRIPSDRTSAKTPPCQRTV